MEVDEPPGRVATRPFQMLPRQATRKEIGRDDVIAKTPRSSQRKEKE
jgi:hypothetical protein